jgi:hypothetical protein
MMLYPADNERARLLRASYPDEPAGSWFQSIQRLFRGPAQSFAIGIHLNCSPDDLNGFGRIFHGT